MVFMGSFIEVSIANGVGRIRLNRPEKRNALTRDFVEQLLDAANQFKQHDDLRVMVLEADGPVFCAGMDLAEMQQRASAVDGPEQWKQDSKVFRELLARLLFLPVPTVAVVQGPVLAGGVGLVLACDFVVSSDFATFSLPEPKRGITAAMVTPLLIHRVGTAVAGQLLMSGETMSANRAHAVGLCYDVTAADQLAQRTESLVNSILTGSRQALATTKKHLFDCTNSELLTLLQDSMSVSANARQSEDAREGLAAFLEKRKPNWDPNSP